MKFYIDKKVFEKFPNLYVAIPVITGFKNVADRKVEKEIADLVKNVEKSLLEEFKTVKDYLADIRIASYFDAFREFGVNPKKIKPTHFALGKRVLEGGHLPSINLGVDLYNAMSIKYVTPFGGENLANVYEDFYMTLAKGDEHWLGIGESSPKQPKAGDLIWRDSYDVSTLSLNWRQCERTKMTEETKDGYFIMDGFADINKENILKAAQEFVKLFTKYFGGEAKILELDKDNYEVEIDYKTKSIDGIEIPKAKVSSDAVSRKETKKDKVVYKYEQESIEEKLQTSVFKALQTLKVETVAEEIDITPSRDSKFGDYSTTVCMRLAKELKKSPLNISLDLVKEIKSEIVNKAEAVAPGFVNIYINTEDLKSQLVGIDDNWGSNDNGKGKQIMIEFGQPNTHKELTMGHVKSGITGLSLSRLFENSGYEVVKANYFGDIGLMISKSLWGVIMKILPEAPILNLKTEELEHIRKYFTDLKDKEGIKAVAKFFSEAYVFGNKEMEKDKAVENQVREINKVMYSKDNEGINEVYRFTRELSIEYQDYVFAELGVIYDRQYPESENMMHGIEIVRENTGKVFKEDDGAIIFDGEPYGLKKFVFMSSDGVPTYSGKDLGLAFKKFEEYPNLDLSIITTSVEQNDYFKNLIKALELIDKKFIDKYTHIGFGWLLFDGKKTSARMGKSFSYEDMLQELIEVSKSKMKEKDDYSGLEIEDIAKKVAIASLKFGILSHEFHKDVNYNPETLLNMNGFSGPYVLYSYARAFSILEKGGEYSRELGKDVLNSDEEQALIKKLLEFPRMAMKARELYASHLICTYLFELANLFNNFYSKHSVLDPENNKDKDARLLLVEAVSKVLKNGLYLIGVDTIEKM